MIVMTKGKSRSTNHWNDGWMVPGGVPKGLSSVELRPWSVISGSCFFTVFFEGIFSFFFYVGSILGGFWEAKVEAKIDFLVIFFRCFV